MRLFSGQCAPPDHLVHDDAELTLQKNKSSEDQRSILQALAKCCRFREGEALCQFYTYEPPSTPCKVRVLVKRAPRKAFPQPALRSPSQLRVRKTISLRKAHPRSSFIPLNAARSQGLYRRYFPRLCFLISRSHSHPRISQNSSEQHYPRAHNITPHHHTADSNNTRAMRLIH